MRVLPILLVLAIANNAIAQLEENEVDPGASVLLPMPVPADKEPDDKTEAVSLEAIRNRPDLMSPVYREINGVLYPIQGYREAPVVEQDESGNPRFERTAGGVMRTQIRRVPDLHLQRRREQVFERIERLEGMNAKDFREAVNPGRPIPLDDGGSVPFDIGEPIPLGGVGPIQAGRDPLWGGRFLSNGSQTVVPSEFLLPPPSIPNDLFHRRISPTETRMSSATMFEGIGFSGAPDKSLLTRFVASPSFGMWYDTGVSASPFSVPTIGLGNPVGAGQTSFSSSDTFVDSVPLSLLLDNQILNLAESQVQVFVEANNHAERDELQLEHIFGRVWDKDSTTVSVGKTHSLFGIGGLAPATIEQHVTLIGTADLNDDKRGQLRIQNAIGDGWSTGIAIEDPFEKDFTVTGTKLTTWPTFVGNFAYRPEGQAENIFQISGLVRTLGFETAARKEHHEAAWGLSAFCRLPFDAGSCSSGNFYLGIAGGEGIGSYISGVTTSAVFSAGKFSTLSGLGAYAGYTQTWKLNNAWEMTANSAYGHSRMQTVGTMAAETNRRLQQGWANMIVSPNETIGVGIEYQYGKRETRAAGDGENHRFMFVVALRSAPAATTAEGVRGESGRVLSSRLESRGTTEYQRQILRQSEAYRQVP